MPALLKNDYWKKRKRHGRKRLFASPEQLRAACEDYFQWMDDYPWIKKIAITRGSSAGELLRVPCVKPYTLSGLCLYLKVSAAYWRNFRRLTQDEGFLSVIEWVEGVIHTQQFEGACVGAFSGRITSAVIGHHPRNSKKTKHKAGDNQLLQYVISMSFPSPKRTGENLF